MVMAIAFVLDKWDRDNLMWLTRPTQALRPRARMAVRDGDGWERTKEMYMGTCPRNFRGEARVWADQDTVRADAELNWEAVTLVVGTVTERMLKCVLIAWRRSRKTVKVGTSIAVARQIRS